jgi:molybdenum cofactor biosynthesis enzyme MoaA
MTTRPPLVDSFDRRIESVRVSVTDRCNFRCKYCMPAEGLQWLQRTEVLTFEEIERLGHNADHYVERVQQYRASFIADGSAD